MLKFDMLYYNLKFTPSVTFWNDLLRIASSSSFDSAGQHLTPHSRTLEVRPGRINKKLELHYDYDVKGMILNY